MDAVTAFTADTSTLVTFQTSGTQSTLVVKVATSGTLPPRPTIGGLTATVIYPSAGYTITEADVAVSGAGAGDRI